MEETQKRTGAMKPARKKQRKGEKAVDKYDRFSDLPDPIIHHIFSFLPNNYISYLSIVSRRLNYLCKSSPFLYLGSYIEDQIKYKKFVHFLDELLCVSSSNGLPIHRFRLRFSCLDGDGTPPYYRWVKNAFKRNVEEIYLQLKSETPNLPLLISASLKELTLSGCYLRGVQSIDSLSLQKLTIFDCTIIKSANISVSAERLEALSVYQIRDYSGVDYSFEICTPNLKSIVWRAASPGYRCSKSLMHLQEAIIGFKSSFMFFDRASWVDRKAELLRNVSYARSLRMDIGFIEELFMGNDNMKLSSISWDKVQHLCVMVRCPIQQFQQAALISFLLQTSNLRSLTIKHDEAANRSFAYSMSKIRSRQTEFNARCKKSEDLTNLEEVEIELRGPRIAKLLRGYLADHAKGLKKMTLTYLN